MEYLEKEWAEFDQVLYIHCHRQALCGIENLHFCMFVIESQPLIEVGFRVISWGWLDRV